MQNAAFKACGIDAEYSLFDVEPARLEEFLQGAARNKIAGLNVTVPHKIKAGEYLEKNGSVDQFASRLGAVNTIKISGDGALCGYNTDGAGFYRSLIQDLKFEPEGKKVFVLGSGGAARAVVMYLANGPAKIYISDVDSGKTADLAERYKKYYNGEKLEIVSGKDIRKTLGVSDLFVNATPLGMNESDPSPVDKNLLPQGIRVYDLVYNRLKTRMVKDANSMKLHAVTGIGMLLYQGAIAFEIWTGKKAPLDVMKRALKDALK